MATNKANEIETNVQEGSAVAEIKKLLAQAKQDAEAIISAAKTEAAGITGAKKGETAPEIRAVCDRGEEPVEVRLFKDGSKYKDDVFVAVNGEGCLIKRGETVRVKRKFADVLEAGMTQDERTAEMQNRYADEFAVETRARGL